MTPVKKNPSKNTLPINKYINAWLSAEKTPTWFLDEAHCGDRHAVEVCKYVKYIYIYIFDGNYSKILCL